MRYLLFITAVAFLHAYTPTKEGTLLNEKQLQALVSPYCVSIPEGEFVYYFHPKVSTWLKQKLDAKTIQTIRQELAPHLKIPLSKEGFTMASTRKSEEEIDVTNYSAIWVRDSCHHYFGLKIGDRASAKTLLLNLLKFYSSTEQKRRCLAVIANPNIANPEVNPTAHMDVPLIRFCRKTLHHHQEAGQDQEWNHLQFDSHALFILAITDGLSSGILSPEDISPEGYATLALFPTFFSKTKYWQRKDSGPWEEVLMHNASTIGLIAAAIREFKNEINPLLKTPFNEKELDHLYSLGLKQVEWNLNLGGEAVDRRADAALLFLCMPENALFHNNPEKIKTVLNITLSLVGPYGVYRYKYDQYQALNYWIQFDRSYAPNQQCYDAQWFFDSIFASIYYHLTRLESDPIASAYYLKRGDIHLKRALGQLTGPNAYAADGQSLFPLCLPESINTVFTNNYLYKPMPSPICPLSWSVASLRIALDYAEKAHQKNRPLA